MEEENKTVTVPIPEGLESRLSASIDRWARRERASKWAAATATCLAVAIAIVLSIPAAQPRKETASDPELAYQEAERALESLVGNVAKGLAILNDSGDYD